MEHLGILLAMAVVVGLSKGGLASAAALAVPFAALFMDPIEAAAILLPVFLVTDWVAVWLYRRSYSRRNLAILIPAMFLGTAIATGLTPLMSEPVLLCITGFIGPWFCARRWLARHVEAASEAGIVPGLFWGILTGITSFITHSGSPPAQAYLLPQRLPKLEFAGTIAIAFSIGNLAKLPGYWSLGVLQDLELIPTLLLALAGILGTILGRWITARLPDETYVRVIEGLLLVLSILLLGRAAMMIAAG
ncbi:sulfite exporter TauE/SafE family protein [Fulvimarina endophytica]|uniref:Probable membrane transporter protein n=1 Tax=Fulvimarina endophytica TaxID=2293836 RepID=A0A371X2L9_9HYPH|nr:sulfite exporter TauE/SafE family protein [Fulvimarina endophytica]RFC63471.1 sulfite exporter TauE/SafE family protein [Fulvimarina endophytica]